MIATILFYTHRVRLVAYYLDWIVPGHKGSHIERGIIPTKSLSRYYFTSVK